MLLFVRSVCVTCLMCAHACCLCVVVLFVLLLLFLGGGVVVVALVCRVVVRVFCSSLWLL